MAYISGIINWLFTKRPNSELLMKTVRFFPAF